MTKQGTSMLRSFITRGERSPRRFGEKIRIALFCAVCLLQSACSHPEVRSVDSVQGLGPMIRIPGTVITQRTGGEARGISRFGVHLLLFDLQDTSLSKTAGTGFHEGWHQSTVKRGPEKLYSIPGWRFIAVLPCWKIFAPHGRYAISADGSIGACFDSHAHVLAFTVRPFHVRWHSGATVVTLQSHPMKVLDNGEVIALERDPHCGVPNPWYPPTRAVLIGENGHTVGALDCALFAVGTGSRIIKSEYDGRDVRFVDPRTGKWVRGIPQAVLKNGSVLYRGPASTLRITGRYGYVAPDVSYADYIERDVIPALWRIGSVLPSSGYR